jgi:hypothetical protein
VISISFRHSIINPFLDRKMAIRNEIYMQYLMMLSIIWGDSADGVDPGKNTGMIFRMKLGLK